MMKDFSVRTTYNNHVVAGLDHDVHDQICGVKIAFVEDGDDDKGPFLRDLESLSRQGALALSLAISELAIRGLRPDEAVELYRQVGESILGAKNAATPPRPSCIIPFPAPARVPYPFPTAGDPADADPTTSAPVGMVEQLTVDPPPADVPHGQLTAEAPRS